MLKDSKTFIPIAIIIAGLLIAGSFFYVNKIETPREKVLSPQEAAEKAINYINQNKDEIAGGNTASLVEVSDVGQVYKIRLKLGENEFDSYVTKDGKYLFPGGYDLTVRVSGETPTTQETPTKGISLEGEPLLGNPDALVTMIEFSEFQCPFCGKYARETFPKVKKEYVDTGKLKIVFKNFPLSFHKNAEIASQAGECALEQEKFWEYKEKLFENQEKLSINDLKKYAQDLNLDTQKFNECLDSGKFKQEVENDFKEGQDSGVSGTPTFFINGEKLVGAQPFSEFQKVIEEKLK